MPDLTGTATMSRRRHLAKIQCLKQSLRHFLRMERMRCTLPFLLFSTDPCPGHLAASFKHAHLVSCIIAFNCIAA